MSNADRKCLAALKNLTAVLFPFRQEMSSAAREILRQPPALVCCRF
jgi:hypothetical protein